MLLIDHEETNPYFNIAAEEYLLKNSEEDIFRIYINQPSVIIGKHQNTLAEINYYKTRTLNIPVIRRLSGGGTVYHDLGNINFLWIVNGEKNNLVNFKKYTSPILSALEKLGVNAVMEGKNDLRVEGLKFSGNAEHVYKNRVLHHGTLLFESNLKILNKIIKPTGGIYTDKAVKSIRSKVTNLKNYIPACSIDELKNAIINELPIVKTIPFQQNEMDAIEQLIKEKYDTWLWNFGYSPDYIFENEIKDHKAQIKVSKGIIQDIQLESNHGLIQRQIPLLIGKKHEWDEIYKSFNSSNERNNWMEILFS